MWGLMLAGVLLVGIAAYAYVTCQIGCEKTRDTSIGKPNYDGKDVGPSPFGGAPNYERDKGERDR